MKSIWFALSLSVAVVSACASETTTTLDGGSGTGKACAKDAECGAGYGCAFAKADGCSAKGECKALPNGNCAGIVEGCACDGTPVNIACSPYGEKYLSKPFKHSGSCSLGTACTTDAECGTPGLRCGFLESEACGAKGTCVKGFTPPCSSNPGCACDGTEVNLDCGLPSGYQSKPLSRRGACAKDGGAD